MYILKVSTHNKKILHIQALCVNQPIILHRTSSPDEFHLVETSWKNTSTVFESQLTWFGTVSVSSDKFVFPHRNSWLYQREHGVIITSQSILNSKIYVVLSLWIVDYIFLWKLILLDDHLHQRRNNEIMKFLFFNEVYKIN